MKIIYHKKIGTETSNRSKIVKKSPFTYQTLKISIEKATRHKNILARAARQFALWTREGSAALTGRGSRNASHRPKFNNIRKLGPFRVLISRNYDGAETPTRLRLTPRGGMAVESRV